MQRGGGGGGCQSVKIPVLEGWWGGRGGQRRVG